MKRSFPFSLALVFVCMLFFTERRAWGFSGYVDPGSGLLALQCITSVAAATAYYLRRQIRALFKSKNVDKAPVSPVAAAPEHPETIA